MELKGKSLPFWGARKKEIDRYKYVCRRFFKLITGPSPESDKYYYDIVVSISVLRDETIWISRKDMPGGKTGVSMSRSGVSEYSELTILPSKAKQMFIVSLF